VPFHDLWIDGGETEKSPPYPQRVIELAKRKEGISETRHGQVRSYCGGLVRRYFGGWSFDGGSGLHLIS
jgi:hypothetical protein